MNLTPATVYRLLESTTDAAILLFCQDWIQMFNTLHDVGLMDDLDGADELKMEPNLPMRIDFRVKNPLREVPPDRQKPNPAHPVYFGPCVDGHLARENPDVTL